MNKKLIIFLGTLTLLVALLVIWKYFHVENTTSAQKPEVVLTIKTPVLQVTSIKDKEVADSYTLMKTLAKKFENEYQDANVKIKVIQFAKEDENDQIIGCFGTNDATDILYEEYFNMSTYIHTGNVAPLDDIITPKIRSDIDNSYWDISKLEGRTYMIPFTGMQNTLCYNKDLFKQVGLEKYVTDENIIQSWSLEDFEIILSTLQRKLPENTYPMLMYGKNEMGDTHIITLLRSRGSTFFDENGRVKLTTPEGIKAIQWLMDSNKKGYFPANSESLEINDCYNLFINGQLAIYINNAVLNESMKQTGINYGNVNFPSIDGKGFNTTFLTGFEVFDNGDEERLKVAKDFIKFVYENDECIEYSAGAIPASNRVSEKYKEELKDVQKYIDNSKYGWNFTGNAPAWRKVRSVFYKDIRELLYGEKTAEEIAKQIEENCNKAIEEGYLESKLHK